MTSQDLGMVCTRTTATYHQEVGGDGGDSAEDGVLNEVVQLPQLELELDDPFHQAAQLQAQRRLQLSGTVNNCKDGRQQEKTDKIAKKFNCFGLNVLFPYWR